MKTKSQIRDKALIITSILFILSSFIGKWLCFTFTLIWLVTVGYHMYNMIKRNYGNLNNFFQSADEMGDKNIKEGKKVRGRIEQSMIPILVLVLFGIICALMGLILL